MNKEVIKKLFLEYLTSGRYQKKDFMVLVNAVKSRLPNVQEHQVFNTMNQFFGYHRELLKAKLEINELQVREKTNAQWWEDKPTYNYKTIKYYV